MNRLINVLILLAAVTFIGCIIVGYGFPVSPFSSGNFWKFTVACLIFAISLTLLQIRDK